MTFVDGSGQSGEPPLGDLDLGAPEPVRSTRRRTAPAEPAAVPMPERIAARPAKRLFLGQTAVDFWGNRRRYFAVSLALLVISALSLTFRGFDLGTAFEDGVAFDVPAAELSVSDARDVLEAHGISGTSAAVDERSSPQGDIVKVRIAEVPEDVRVSLQEAFAAAAGVEPADVRAAAASSSWDEQASRTAIVGVGVFVLVFLVVSAVRFEWRMAVAAVVAMLHDVVIAAGIYSLFGFSVTPPIVVVFVAILVYTLYDTVVVFDRAKENERRMVAAGLGPADLVNVSTNQVLMRSLITSWSVLLPVLSLLLVGAVALGQVTLREFAVTLLIGMLIGTCSSIFVAFPLLGVLKGGERGSEHLTGEDLRTVVARGVGILTPIGGRRRGGRPAAVPAGTSVRSRSTAGSTPAGAPHTLEPSAEQLLGRAPRPRKKKRH